MPRNQSNAKVADPVFGDPTVARRMPRLADRGLFLKKFLEKGTGISAAVPSSKALCRAVIRPIDFSKPSTIVELGAGTGPVTEEILERLRPHHRFAAVEFDPDFCDVMRRRFPEVNVIEGDASRVREPLAALGIHKVDYVVSGLPTPNLPRRASARLWSWLREALNPGGAFLQITVAPLLYRPFYDRLFENVEYRMVWWNMPPGGVYICRNPRERIGSRWAD